MALLFLLAGAAVDGALAQEQVSRIETRLLVGARGDDGVRAAGLQLTVEEGWKTYWRNPGEAGVPPRFDWSGSGNLAEARIAWPVPKVFESFGYTTIGYSGETVLPLVLIPEDASKPIDLRLTADLGVCKDVCIFETVQIARTVEPGDPGPDQAAVADAESRVTPLAAEAGIHDVVCTIAGAGEDRAFSARIDLSEAVDPTGETVVSLEGPDGSWFKNTEVAETGDGLDVAATLSLEDGAAWIDRSTIRMTILGPGFAADIIGCPAG